ncbi:putative RNA-binding protein [Neolecta irregularis DAH-3]|uniref:Putative RNA-binding protein n=1 Tax=Neolecta irregularis (strain DAH-3) TaxID=1198029 RepID=A0A1U7LQY6_NEOID|nr:putative RNA-binding protein [Neolecta irregularis DAH-3]|eukprot:OLL25075.1 putative RNA-binding protein [Neolecta irregularis DAH-3]
MFIGGLNWETSDGTLPLLLHVKHKDSLKNYFSQYGDVAECTVMRDGATGRSRGFGFLTFKDPKCVNTVMVKEHYLDGKIVRPLSLLPSPKIDPKRAIPREEQDKTSKIFVGGVSQECTDSDFREYFAQFGRVLDATLMMDKDTGRPRGFGFVTFESDAAVENALAQPVLMIKEKQIEVKRATPKGGPSFGSSRNDFGNDAYNSYNQAPQQQFAQSQHNYYNGMSPAAMAQYYRQMQQYYSAFQQQMGRGMARPMMMPGMPTAINMQGMNPAMMGYGQQQAADQQYSMPDSTDQWANNGSVKSDEDISKVPANAPKGPAGGSSVGRGSFRGRGNFRGAGRGAPGGARFNPYGR